MAQPNTPRRALSAAAVATSPFVVAYLAGALMGASFNPADWDATCRAIIALSAAVLAFFTFVIALTMPE